MKTSHVVQIITRLDLGGAQNVCLLLFKGHPNSSIITGSIGPLVSEVESNPNAILLESMKWEVSSIKAEIKNFINLYKTLLKLKKKHGNILVHTHAPKAGLLGRWAAFFAGIKRVHTIHGYSFNTMQNNKIAWLVVYLLELITSLITNHFICVSSLDIETGKKLFPFFKRKYTLIRAAIDRGKFSLESERPFKTPFIFGTVSCFKEGKNLPELFKAFLYVNKKNPDTYLEVIGDGNLRNELVAWINEHNMQDRIILHGWQKDITGFISNWNIFVFTSLWEGLPCAVVEARFSKLPVLSYKTGGIPEIIIPGKNGILYDKGDWLSLAKDMLNISLNPELYRQLQEYNDDLSDFDSKNMVAKHSVLYQDLMKK